MNYNNDNNINIAKKQSMNYTIAIWWIYCDDDCKYDILWLLL